MLLIGDSAHRGRVPRMGGSEENPCFLDSPQPSAAVEKAVWGASRGRGRCAAKTDERGVSVGSAQRRLASGLEGGVAPGAAAVGCCASARAPRPDLSLRARSALSSWPPLCVPCRHSPPRAARRPQLHWAMTRATSCSRSWPSPTRAWTRLRPGAAPRQEGKGRRRDEDGDRCS